MADSSFVSNFDCIQVSKVNEAKKTEDFQENFSHKSGKVVCQTPKNRFYQPENNIQDLAGTQFSSPVMLWWMSICRYPLRGRVRRSKTSMGVMQGGVQDSPSVLPSRKNPSFYFFSTVHHMTSWFHSLANMSHWLQSLVLAWGLGEDMPCKGMEIYPMLASLESSSSPSVLAHWSISWHVTATCWLVEQCETAGRAVTASHCGYMSKTPQGDFNCDPIRTWLQNPKQGTLLAS